MDEVDQKSHSSQQIQPLNAELTIPMEGEQGRPGSEEAASQSENITIAPKTVFADSIPPSVVAATSSLSFLERYWKLALVLILVLGLAFRTRGLNWDEGQHLHPDERFLTMVESTIKLPSSLSQYFDTARSPLNPYNNNFGSFVYGTAPLFFVRLIGQLAGWVDYERIVLLGRALSAFADIFVAAMVFAIGRRLYGLRIGLFAALLYALSVLPIKQSHYFTVDTFTNVPLMLAFWFTLDIAEGKRGLWAFVLAGSCFGWILASRINLAPFFGIIVLAAFLQWIKTLGAIQHIHLERAHPGLKPGDEAIEPLITSDSTAVSEVLPVRLFRIGPFLIEIEFKPQATASPARIESKSGDGKQMRRIIVGLLLSVIAAVLIFRVAQPYAFTGFFKLNPAFVNDMASAQRLAAGQADYPPGHQWAYRIPYWFPWYNMVFWGLGPALGFAAWLGVALAAFQVWRNRRWEHLLILLWVVGMFLYHGQQFVLTMRYFLPLYPFLAVFAAFFLFALWDGAKALAQSIQDERLARSTQFFAGLLFAIVLGATLFWAIASASIYTRTNTRVAASRWIYANVPDKAVLGTEHWDDILPLRVDGKDYYSNHQGVILELYAEDTPEKREKMVQWMDQVDYIVLSSNRLYGSIPRLPMRFPLTTKYYDWLFNGQLGFEPVQVFTSYPQFLDITINDDHAEEVFTVYDHPKVIIFRKTSAYSHDNTVKLFNSVDLTEVLRLTPLNATVSRRQFQMTPAEVAANRAGGTWSALFDPKDLANRFPIPLWLVIIWLTGIFAFPFTFIVFRAFADRGYAFAKALGILFVAWFAWTLSSYHILPFGRLPILFGLMVMIASSLLMGRQHWQEMRAYIRTNLKLLLVEELLFFVFFAIDLGIRYHNPDLWHPSLGGEKPMDFAFLNAILRTTYFPPSNPWFAGNYINYYYFGQLISAVLIRLSGITPEVAYNLLIPLFFALTASRAYSIVFNLVSSGRQRLRSKPQASTEETGSTSILVPSLAGIFGIFLVLIIGNLGEIKIAAQGLIQLGGGSGIAGLISGLTAWLVGGKAIPVPLGDWYWTATRVIPDTINEFPFFTFLYADLHAHLIAIPYTLAALGLAAHIVLNRSKLQWHDLGIIALVLGALRAINTWDYPTYLGIIGAAILLRLSTERNEYQNGETFDLHQWLQQWLRFLVIIFFQIVIIVIPADILGIRVNLEMAIYLVLLLFGIAINLSRGGRFWNPNDWVGRFAVPFLTTIILSIVLYFPYIVNYATGYASLELWKGDRTTLGEYLTVHGIFLFMAGTFLVITALMNYLKANTSPRSGIELTGWSIYSVPVLVLADIVLIVLKLPVFALVLPIISLAIWILLQRRTSMEVGWVTMLMIVSLLLTLLVEVVVLKGDIGRTNTVFKFYLQAWILFGVACATGLGLIIEHLALRRNTKPVEAASLKLPASTSQRVRWAWWGVFSILILAGLLYPFVAARAKMNDRYVAGSPPGLNGMDYMKSATYNENGQDLVLRSDYDAIQWMRANIKGSPVIMEANDGLYHWGDRYSIYTGLPTVIGWDWHTKQQYSLIPGDLVDYRISVVKEFYNTTDQSRAIEIARRYDVSYVIVGGLERAVYDANGLNKFEAMAEAGTLVRVYDANNVQIYQVPLKTASSNQ